MDEKDGQIQQLTVLLKENERELAKAKYDYQLSENERGAITRAYESVIQMLADTIKN